MQLFHQEPTSDFPWEFHFMCHQQPVGCLEPDNESPELFSLADGHHVEVFTQGSLQLVLFSFLILGTQDIKHQLVSFFFDDVFDRCILKQIPSLAGKELPRVAVPTWIFQLSKVILTDNSALFLQRLYSWALPEKTSNFVDLSSSLGPPHPPAL